MAVPAVSTTQSGTSGVERFPLATSARVMTPIVFWASLAPWV